MRDAAIRCFGREGFGVPVRTVAQEACVSAALVIHHYGSK
ncbi:MAG TPA: TetR family transcriptional regulator, partial [Blastococcus sp.]